MRVQGLRLGPLPGSQAAGTPSQGSKLVHRPPAALPRKTLRAASASIQRLVKLVRCSAFC